MNDLQTVKKLLKLKNKSRYSLGTHHINSTDVDEVFGRKDYPSLQGIIGKFSPIYGDYFLEILPTRSHNEIDLSVDWAILEKIKDDLQQERNKHRWTIAGIIVALLGLGATLIGSPTLMQWMNTL